MTHKEKICYLAGLIDGEGWIGISKQKTYSKTANPVYIPNITIKMTDRKPLDIASSILTGKVYTHATLPSEKIPYSWRLANAPFIIPALETLMPFLVSKKEVAKIVLKYCHRIKGTNPHGVKLPKKEITLRHNVYITCKELNSLN